VTNGPKDNLTNQFMKIMSAHRRIQKSHFPLLVVVLAPAGKMLLSGCYQCHCPVSTLAPSHVPFDFDSRCRFHGANVICPQEAMVKNFLAQCNSCCEHLCEMSARVEHPF